MTLILRQSVALHSTSHFLQKKMLDIEVGPIDGTKSLGTSSHLLLLCTKVGNGMLA